MASSFLDLPREIRDVIYENIVERTKMRKTSRRPHCLLGSKLTAYEITIFTSRKSLLVLNKQISKEYKEAFMRSASTFRLEFLGAQMRDPRSTDQTLSSRMSASLPQWFFSSLRQVIISFSETEAKERLLDILSSGKSEFNSQPVYRKIVANL